jgi:hypothetical protein
MALSINNTEVVDLGSLPISGHPFTLAGWFRVPNVSKLLTLLRVENSQTGSYHAIYFRGNIDDRAGAISKVGVAAAAKSTTPMIPGQWHHVAGVFEADDLRRVYLDGGSIGTSSSSRIFDGADQTVLGNISSSDAVDVAEIAVIDGALSEEQIAILASGFSILCLPSVARLMTYHDCLRGINRPGVGPVATNSGTPSVTAHPRVMWSSGGRSQLQPFRIRGPLRIDRDSCRTSFSEQAQQSVAGVGDNAGQTSVAGIDSNSTVLYGEVHNECP